MRLILIISLYLLHSCRPNSNQKPITENLDITGKNDRSVTNFWQFHNRFVNDPEFQKSSFLEFNSTLDSDFSKAQTIYSLFRERAISGMPVYDTMFAGYSILITGDSVIERIFDDGGQGTSQRIFKKSNQKWYLSRYEKPIWYYPYNRN